MSSVLSPTTRLIRMRALSPTELPAHPALAAQQTEAGASLPGLQEFLAKALKEGESFMTSYLDSNFAVKSQAKRSPPSEATVKLLAHDRHPDGTSAGSEPTEAWFARESIHENTVKDGTASWTEFDQGLRANHSQHEADYTPSVRDAHRVLDWSSELESPEHNTIDAWKLVDMAIMEMVHKIPSPLNDRVFPLVVVTAQQAHQFLVVQIPVNLAGVTSAKWTSEKSVTTGMYCSVELGELVEQDTKVRWRMATASDAKGVLPMWIQKFGVPGAVIKDVGWFIEWVAKNRRGRQ